MREEIMVKHSRKNIRSRYGLSHFEMMIVVSVIIVIAAIILPVLLRFKRHGEQTHCLGNERQLMTAWYNYAIDSDDRLCDPDLYISSLLPYTQSPEVFYCVSVKSSWVETNTYTDANSVASHTGSRNVNSLPELSPEWPVDPMRIVNNDGLENVASYAISNTMGGRYRDGIRPFYKYQEIKKPGMHMVITDIEPPAGPTFWPIARIDEDSWTWRPRSWPPSLQGLTNRHNNGINFSFADGHGAHYKWSDRSTIEFIAGFTNSDRGTVYYTSDPGGIDLGRMVKMLGRD